MQGNKDDFTSTGDEKVTTGCVLTIYVKVLLQIQRISDLKTQNLQVSGKNRSNKIFFSR